MKKQSRVVIVGGGISGLSALYHLTLEGWTDVVLLERNELTSGTTWHSAAQCPQLAFNQLLLLLRQYTISLYKELADDPDYPINYHHRTGGLRLLTQQHHVDACHHILSVAKGVNIDFELIDAAEAVRRNPLLNGDGLLGALWDELDGDIDPAQLCQALARRSRKAGAEIIRHCPVTAFTQRANDEWIVHSEKGDIHTEHVVIAAGYRVHEIGKMLDINYPVVSMEHMYFITEDVPDLLARDSRVPMIRCPQDTFYLRQEKKGLLIGVYEHDCKTFGQKGIDPDFASALCPNDLDRCLPKIEAIFRRLPCLEDVGIKSIVNGPIAYASDAGPLLGKQPGRRNLWSMNGIRVGIGEGGGYGKMLAQMIVHGQAEWDTWSLDPRRISSHVTKDYTAAKAIEDYQHEFQWHMPHEHRLAGRPLIATPLYEKLKVAGAQFGVVNGWERAEYYHQHGELTHYHSYSFPNWHAVVAEEVAAVQNRVGLAELSGFNRIEITGQGAFEWLDSLSCSTLPSVPGKVALCYFLNLYGNIEAEATVLKISDDHLLYCSAAAAELHDMDFLSGYLPGAHSSNGDGIRLNNLAGSYTVLVIAGPDSRSLLSSVSPTTRWGQAEFPWMSARDCLFGEIEVMVMAVSFSGEQAFELHIANTGVQMLYEELLVAGENFGLKHFGMFAIESMRLEKGYGHWKQEFITEFNPVESGLNRFVNFQKTFPGKTALELAISAGNRRQRVLLVIDSTDAPAQSGETVFEHNKPVGTITSAGWGHRIGKNLAMAFVDPAFAVTGAKLTVRLIGQRTQARVAELCLYDKHHALPRGSGVPGQ